MAAHDIDPFQGPEVIRLFPTFVWKAGLPPVRYRPLNAAIVAQLESLAPAPEDRGSMWQSGHGLHQHPAFADLVSAIDSALHEVLAFLKVGEGGLQITGCWANISAPGGWHRMHSHPNNFLSGVYYVQVQDGADTINFHDPRPQSGILRPPVSALTAYNTDLVVVKAEIGTLLVFPAWLPHSVDENRSSARRISVSFNVMFPDFAERLAQPLWGDGGSIPT
jgi:uncharacterized protein (TIGR02466 family)